MKKILTCVLGLLLCFSNLSHIQAKSVETLDKSGQIVNSGYSLTLTVDGEETRVIYGTNGIDILKKDGNVHLDTTFAVKKMTVISDVDGDGQDDFFAYENATANADQLFVISSKDGKVLRSMRYTHLNVDSTASAIQENSSILKMEALDDDVLFICDYDLILLDPATGEEISRYSAEDNIWDFEITENYLVVSEQTGCLTILDKQMNLLCKEKITQTYLIDYAYYDPDWGNDVEKIQKELSLFDIYVDPCSTDTVYVASEEGRMYVVDLTQLANTDYLDSDNRLQMEEIWVSSLSEDTYKTNISYTYDDTEKIDGALVGMAEPAGYYSSSFMAFRFIDADENYILISGHVNSDEMLESSDYNSETANIILYDRANKTCVHFASKDTDKCISAKLIEYKEKTAVLVVGYSSQGKLKAIIYDLNEDILLQNELTMSTLAGSHNLKLTANDEGYLVEVLNEGVVQLNKELNKVTYLYETYISKLVNYDENGYTLSYATNGAIIRLVRYDSSSAVQWQYDLDNKGNYQGMEGLISDDYNNDGVADYMFVARNYDKDNKATYGKYTVVNGKDGSLIKDSLIVSGTGYNDYGYSYPIYATSTEFKMIKDQDRDGLDELLLDSCYIISSRDFNVKAFYGAYIETDGQLLNVGDVNSDGFDDYVEVTNKKAQLHVSYASNYEVEYYRNLSAVSLKEKGENSYYAIVLGDIDQDGAKEFVVNNFNDQGYQVFDVYSSKTMQLMYTLCKDGVGYYESIMVSDLDINHDGYLELQCYSDRYYADMLVDGKSGETLYMIDNEGYAQIYSEEYYYAPEYLIQASTTNDMSSFSLVSAGDRNNDGIDDLMTISRSYDYETWKVKRYLRICSGADFSVLSETVLGTTDSWQLPTLNSVKNSDDLLTYSDESTTSLIRRNGEAIADYSMQATDYIYLNETGILACTESNVYVLNTEKSFTLEDEIPQTITNATITVHWKALVDYSTMNIYDNGVLVYSGTDNETTFHLLEGKHSLSFALADADGKSSKTTIDVVVENKNNPYVWLIAPTAVGLAGLLLIMLYRKIYIRKKYNAMKGETA